MEFMCQEHVENLAFYFNLNKKVRVYIKDLNHQAPLLRAEAVKENVKIYGCYGRRSLKEKWVAFVTQGTVSPKTYSISFSNGVQLIDYNSFDTDKNATLEDMKEVASEVENFIGDEKFSTCSSLVRAKYSKFLTGEMVVNNIEKEYYRYLQGALRGGANAIMPRYQMCNIKREIHVDIHQNYANILLHNSFPCGMPKEVDGYFPHEFAIYAIEPGSKAKLKQNGYPLIPRGFLGDGMVGEDGEWFDAGLEIQFISDPDLQILNDNYELKDFAIVSTLYYPESFKGEDEFKKLIYECYIKRKNNKGKAAERFYKMLNEIIPGNFQRTVYFGSFWNSKQITECGYNEDKRISYFNPKIGIFITAYARQRLNDLLQFFNKEKVIGYDTDAIFFAGTKNMLREEIRNQFSDEIGGLHIDLKLINSFHKASKSYYGTDEITGEVITRFAGVSKQGYKWMWNEDTLTFEKVDNNDTWGE